MGSRPRGAPRNIGVFQRAIVARTYPKTNCSGWDVEQAANIVCSFFQDLNLTMVQDIRKPQKCR